MNRSPGSSGSPTGRWIRTGPVVPGANVLGAQDAHRDAVFAGADVGEVGASSRHVVAEGGQDGERRVESIGQPPAIGFDHGVAATDRAVIDRRQVERHALALARSIRRAVPPCSIERTRADRCARFDDDLVADPDRPVDERAGHDGATPLRGERRGRPTAAPGPDRRRRRPSPTSSSSADGVRRARHPCGPTRRPPASASRKVPSTWSATSRRRQFEQFGVDEVATSSARSRRARARAARGSAGAPRTAASTLRWRRRRRGSRRCRRHRRACSAGSARGPARRRS